MVKLRKKYKLRVSYPGRKKRKIFIEFFPLSDKYKTLTEEAFSGLYDKEDYDQISHLEFKAFRKVFLDKIVKDLGKEFNVFFALNDKSVFCVRKEYRQDFLLIKYTFEFESRMPKGKNFLAVKKL